MLISNSRRCVIRIVVGITTLITLLACTGMAAGAASATWVM